MADEKAVEAHEAAEAENEVLEGIFAISKPTNLSSGALLLTLQSIFHTSTLFAPLLAHTQATRLANASSNPQNPLNPSSTTSTSTGTPKPKPKPPPRPFHMGHAGTLDPLATGILLLALGRATKSLPSYLSGSKTYETTVLFGVATDSYDVTGAITARGDTSHVTEALVRQKVAAFSGVVKQVPPLYSGLKVGGRKAVEWVSEGGEVPGGLEARDVVVEEVEVMGWGEGEYVFGGENGDGEKVGGKCVRVRLRVGAGFYVRSFAHDLGIACGSVATMVELVRTEQGGFVLDGYRHDAQLSGGSEPQVAITYHQILAGEHTWGPLIKSQLKRWMDANPVPEPRGHVNGRDPGTKKRLGEEEKARVRQRFRGEWVGTSRRERRRQQRMAKEARAGVGGKVDEGAKVDGKVDEGVKVDGKVDEGVKVDGKVDEVEKVDKDKDGDGGAVP